MENLAALYRAQYREAHELLTTDPEQAENRFNDLLHQFRMPLWMRVKCNTVLAGITSNADHAGKYLRDARHVLELFKEGRPTPDPMQAQIDGISGHLNEVEQDIAIRHEVPWEDVGDDDLNILPSQGELPADDEATPLPSHAGTPADDSDVRDGIDRMLLGYEGHPETPALPAESSDVTMMDLDSQAVEPSSQTSYGAGEGASSDDDRKASS